MLPTTGQVVDWIWYGSREGTPLAVRIMAAFLLPVFLTVLVIIPSGFTILLFARLMPDLFVFDTSSFSSFLQSAESQSFNIFIVGFVWLMLWIGFSAIWDTNIANRRKR